MAEFLADKSARTRLAGRIATRSVIDVELRFKARSPAGHSALASALQEMPRVGMSEPIMAELAAASQHRSVSLPDLLVAACAEHHALTVLHYDTDFDRVAAITGQPTRWVVAQGTVS